MRDGKIRIVVGVILVVLQVISVLGLLTGYTELWDTSYSMSSDSSSVTGLKQLLFGLEVGSVKFEAGLEEVRESFVDTDDYNYRSPTTEEIIAANFRGILKDGDVLEQGFLFLFDVVTLIGFCTYGILGALLISFGRKAAVTYQRELMPVDLLSTPGNKVLQIASVVLAALFGILIPLGERIRYDDLSDILLPDLLIPAALVCWGVFFAFYFGRKRSVLVPAALCFFAAGALATALDTLGSFFLAEMDMYLLLDLLDAALAGTYGGFYLYSAICLYRGKPKESVRKWAIAAATLVACYSVLIPLVLALTVDLYALILVDLYCPVFAGLYLLYIFTVKSRREQEKAPVDAMPSAPAANCCPMCGEPVNRARVKCAKCGTAIPALSVESPMPAPQPPLPETMPVQPVTQAPDPSTQGNRRHCTACGVELSTDSAFCHRCGTKVPPRQICFCRRCGEKLVTGSSFCSRCGTKVSQ